MGAGRGLMADRVAIVGLGRVGLPLALHLAERGWDVDGVDVDAERLASLAAGRMPFLEEGAQALLTGHLGRRFRPTGELAVMAEAAVVVITLGTPVDDHNNPVFQPIEGLVRKAVPHLRRGQLLVLRSTVSPGTTELLGRLIERETGLRIGTDLFLAFCPERIAEGHSIAELPEVPQIVGGVDAASTAAATRFFAAVTAVVHETDARSAELAKLFCNMYRYIDFAISNEFMMIAEQHDRDVHPILHAINAGYKRGGIKTPGLTGGPCLYKDGFFLTRRIAYNELISDAWKIHETMPAYLIDRVRALRRLEGTKTAVLGLAFKKDIDDPRNSLAYKLRKLLLAEGAAVHLHDPLIPSEPLDDALRGASAVFLAMNHTAFRAVDLAMLRRLVAPDAVVCDIWNHFGTGKTVFPLASR